jgi:hypothetical protein
MKIATKISLVLVVLVAAGIGSTVFAKSPNAGCVKDAAQAKVLCKAQCEQTFLAAKDLCRNIDHDCADQCRAGLVLCLEGSNQDGPLPVLDACVDTCNATLETAKANCRQLYPQGSADRANCIDQAQVTAFQCRDTCREGVAAAIRACRMTFHTCIMACPAPPAQ